MKNRPWLGVAASLLLLGGVLAGALPSCGGSSVSSEESACLGCANEMCPDESKACNASLGCVKLRTCSLACKTGDATCQNNCTAAEASDSTALLAGADFLACADAMCAPTCLPTATTTGTGGSASGGSIGSGGSTGNGGASPTGGSTGSGGTTGTGGSTSTAYTVGDGGYVTSGPWMGYAFTATDGKSATTISPTDFSTVTAGESLCVSGTVAATADYSAVAILGINLNQAATANAVAGTWTPTGSGINYELYDLQGTDLRIQIQAAGGDTNASLRWCVDTQTYYQPTIAWSRFNTACWDGSGTDYDGTTPLQSIMVVVPGSTTDIPYNFCIQFIDRAP